MSEESEDLYGAANRTIRWLEECVVRDARGDDEDQLPNAPSGRFWLGRLAPQDHAGMGSTDRGARMDPSASGVRFKPNGAPPWTWRVSAGFVMWTRAEKQAPWRKSEPVLVEGDVTLEGSVGIEDRWITEFEDRVAALGCSGYSARVEIEVEETSAGPSVTLTLVNQTSPELPEPNLYEAWLSVEAGETKSFVLDALPDSFRYDRTVPAYGINGGAEHENGIIRTTDVVLANRERPRYWSDELGEPPDLRFETLAIDPLTPLRDLVARARDWGDSAWSSDVLDERASKELWNEPMREEARTAQAAYAAEVDRLEAGVQAIAAHEQVLRAFCLMNEAMAHAARGRYDGWRPFQIGFQLQAIPTLVDPSSEDRTVVDTLWFATGGGKTETYLGLVVLACLLDRIRGKTAGVTAWSRFPLRMLSLQQMQRFADALAGAELARQRHDLGGVPFRLGFFVGAAGTPNRIREDPRDNEVDANDDEMPDRYQRVDRCPFCGERSITMAFDRRVWMLEHRCTNDACPWSIRALPLLVVDEEIFRMLPSVVVGTLDKAASIAWQAAMRGLIGAPLARCTGPGHGYRYAPRSTNWKGCLVPDCGHAAEPLGQARETFAPSLRVQDELHLLRDSLGAVDSQYETLLDHLQSVGGAPPPKILASSATLAGHDKQIAALYLREGRVFPQPGSRSDESFWSRPSQETMRRFLALGPRGQTLEYAADRIATVLQTSMRRLTTEPAIVCAEIGISAEHVAELLSLYGTQVVYGSRLRDVEAAARSFGSEIPVAPLNFVTMTGGTPFDEVRLALERLSAPEDDFDERIHLVAASSMMSHGVDVDRLNVITMLGLPLSTAEFIQTTARIGRRYPGLVLVLHRMGGERDASAYRSFPTWIAHGDRFIEAVPITRRSRRVLQLAYPGAFMARVLDVHEPRALALTGRNLTKAARLRDYFRDAGIDETSELGELYEALGIDPGEEPGLASDLELLVRATFDTLEEPEDLFSNQLCRERPMTSLRDVEAQAPIVEYDPALTRRRGR
jgi:hypothetical protein